MRSNINQQHILRPPRVLAKLVLKSAADAKVSGLDLNRLAIDETVATTPTSHLCLGSVNTNGYVIFFANAPHKNFPDVSRAIGLELGQITEYTFIPHIILVFFLFLLRYSKL